MTLAYDFPSPRPALAESLLPRVLTRSGTTVLLGAVLTALAAQVSVPVPGSPVPVTGQTFAVLMTATALGPAQGFASQLLYLLLGALGLPVFTDAQHGIHAFSGATGGYLLGFLAAAAIAGFGARHGADRSSIRALASLIPASGAIYLFGASWLSLSTGMSPGQAISVGVVPFLFGDAMKALLAAGLLPGAWKLLRRFEGNGS
ncbi:biotin transporter BioY [Streptomyces sp. NPDC021080]|uniref:biotin transporter BioY n=1 Tax=Streptomyces sp. NPDC021080 TaxID=3365110 RepID=UPI0037BCAC61